MTSRQHGTTTRVSGAARSTRNDTKLSARQGSKRSGQPRSQQMTIGDPQTRVSGQGSQGASRQTGRLTGRQTSRQTAGTAKSNRLVQSRLSNQVVFRHTPSQAGESEARSYASQYDDEDGEYEEGEEGEEGEYENEEDQEMDDDDVQSAYIEDYYPEYASTTGAKKVNGPRVEIMDGPDPCHCFPKKSNKHIPSMMYENITCKHSGVTGEAHAGVFRFDFNWNEFMEEPKRRKRSQAPPKTNFVKGYPNPEFLGGEYVEEEEEEDEDDDDDNTQQEVEEETDDEDDNYTYDGYEAFDGRWGKQSDDDDYDDEEEEEDEEEIERQRALEEAMAKPSGIRAIIPLPQIGYSPPPSRERSTPMSQRSVPYSLPPLPESPYMSAQGRQTAQSYGSGAGSRLDSRDSRKGRFRVKKTINTVRRFQGRMYDPASKKVVSYDITPAFRANLDSWHAHIDSGSSTGSRLSRQSTVPSRRSVKVESRHTNIPEEDDEDEEEDEYDDDDDDDEDDEDDY